MWGVTHAEGVLTRVKMGEPLCGAGLPCGGGARRLQNPADLDVLARARCGWHRLVEPLVGLWSESFQQRRCALGAAIPRAGVGCTKPQCGLS